MTTIRSRSCSRYNITKSQLNPLISQHFMTVHKRPINCTVALDPLLFTNEINMIRGGWNWGENDGWRWWLPVDRRGPAWGMIEGGRGFLMDVVPYGRKQRCVMFAKSMSLQKKIIFGRKFSR